LGSADDIWAAAFSANDNPVLSASGKLEINIKGKPFDHPWGQVFAQPTSGSPAFYATNAGNGDIIRINLGSKFTYDVIATGFAVNHGKPGSIFAPSGLTYDPTGDQLYVVDGTNNTVVAFSNVTSIPAGGIKVGKDGKTFSGPSAKDARLVFSGKPLNGPISAALLANGNIVVGNTGNPSGENLLVEISASGKLMDVRNVDKGASGALFGVAATGTSAGDTKVYFNDDNDNNLQVLER
jgi:DNA-binding beta-propeller fold protein YncE